MKQKGRPKIIRNVETLDFTTFQEDITIFKNYLIDVVTDVSDEDDEDPNVPIIRKFLLMENWKQNIFIVYLLSKDKKIKNNAFSFKALADLLQVERNDLMKVIKNIKKELQVV